ncbi:MAG: DNA polymerase III subunit gamma/tau domain-containing protein [Anaerolineae bacterium]
MSPESEANERTTNHDSLANRIIKRMLRRVVNLRLGQSSRWVLRAADRTSRLRKPLGLAIPTTRAMMRRMSQDPGERVPERPEMPLARMLSTGPEAIELSEEPAEAPYEASNINLAPPAEVKRLSFDEMTAILQRNTEEMKAGRAGRPTQPQPTSAGYIPSASVAGHTEPTMPAGKPLAVPPSSQSGLKRVPRSVRVQELTPSSTRPEDIESRLSTPAPTPDVPTQAKPIATGNRPITAPHATNSLVARTASEPLAEPASAPAKEERDILPTEERRLATIGRVIRTSATLARIPDAPRTTSQPVVVAIRREQAVHPTAVGVVSSRLASRSEPAAPVGSLPPANRVQQARVVSREPIDQQPGSAGQDIHALQAPSDETEFESVVVPPSAEISAPATRSGQTPTAGIPSEATASSSLSLVAPTRSARAPLRRTRKPKPGVVETVTEGSETVQPNIQSPSLPPVTSSASEIARTESIQVDQVQPTEIANVVGALPGDPVTQLGHPEVTPTRQVTARRTAKAKPSPRKRQPESAQPVARVPEASLPDEVLAGIPLEEALGLLPRTRPHSSSTPGVESTHSDAAPHTPDASGLEIHREPLHQALFGPAQPLSTEQIVRASVARVAREECTQSAPSLSQAGVSDDDVIPAVNVQLIRRRGSQPDAPAAAGSYETALPLRRTVTVDQVESTTSQPPASSSGESTASSASTGASASTTEAASTPTAASTPAVGGVGQMDIQELTEEVYRRLRDILRIEEERYGHQRDRW